MVEKLNRFGWDKANIVCLNTRKRFPYQLLLSMLLAWKKEGVSIEIGKNVLLVSQGDFHINFIKGGVTDGLTNN